MATPDQTDLLRSRAQRRGDALVDICRFFLDHQQTHAGGRHRPHLNVVVELKDLEARRGGQVLDGPALDGATVSWLFCDSAVHRVVMRGRSAILDYGTATRTGWHAKLRPDGEFGVTDPDGIVRETSPPRAEALW